MKKILIFVLIMFIPLGIDALSIDKIYIDGEIEIAGGLHVKEIITINDFNEDLIYKVNLKDPNTNKFNGSIESFISSSIYDATDIKMEKFGTLKENTKIEEITKEGFLDKYFIENEDGYVKTLDGDHATIKMKKTNKNTTIYLEYVITNILVEHNDCAEFYYAYFRDFGYDVNSITILTYLPGSSELFDVWSHGNKKNMYTAKDIRKYLVLNEIENYKKGTRIDNRIIFDKELFQININKEKKSEIDAKSKIKKTEAELEKTVDTAIIKNVLYGSIGLLVVILSAYLVYMKKSKKKS